MSMTWCARWSAGGSAGEKEFGVTVLWLIDAVRHFGAEEGQRVFRKAAELRSEFPAIVGIGIGGDEARGPADLFREAYAEAREAGLRLTAHAGESTGPESIWSAINIGAERIGHALAAQKDPELMQILAERQIPLEMNVTSNLRTGCCAAIEEHPLRMYFESGLMVTLNSDDPPMFGSDLLGEYLLALREYEFSLDQIREIAANGGRGELSRSGTKAGAAGRGGAVRMVRSGPGGNLSGTAYGLLQISLEARLLPSGRRGDHYGAGVHLGNAEVAAEVNEIERAKIAGNLDEVHVA